MAQALLSEEQLQARDAARRAKASLQRERAQAEAADAARRETEGRLGRLEVTGLPKEGGTQAREIPFLDS